MSRRVVVVEDRAHLAVGHFPDSAAALAAGFADLGCEVELLTAEGWLGEGEEATPPFRVARASRPVAALLRLADRLAARPSPAAGARGAWAQVQAGAVLRALGLAAMVRSAVRRDPARTEVVMYAYGARPILAAALDGPGRIVHHAIWDAPAPRPTTFAGRELDRAARRAERRRRRGGGGMRVAVGNEAMLDTWRVRTPFLDPVLLRHAVARKETRVAGARARFGIAEDLKVALVFGTLHGGKDLDTVWRAFAELPEWTLLVVGMVTQAYEQWCETHDGPAAVTSPGFVDDATRDAAFSAADIAVLSFVGGHGGDSAVLLDALSFGVPVVCTDVTRAAADVVEHRLGACFPAGDAGALAAAVRRAPGSLDPHDVDRALATTSAVAVARAHLAALDGIDRPGRVLP